MKTNRRGFFAAMLAPLLGRLMLEPLPPWTRFLHSFYTTRFPMQKLGESGLTEEDFDYPSLNRMLGAADYDFCPHWDGNIYPTYGLISRSFIPPMMARQAAEVSRKTLKLQLVKAGYLPAESLLKDEDFEK